MNGLHPPVEPTLPGRSVLATRSGEWPADQPEAAPVAASHAPLVTVIVPVFNGAQFIRQSLDSILRQTYPRLEILVMDDASTDATPTILTEYAARLRVVRQPVNRGQFANVNDGIALAQGSLIAVYHSDDEYEPTIVARSAEYLCTNPAVAAVFCKDRFIDPGGQIFGRLELPAELVGGGQLDYQQLMGLLMTYKNRFLRCPGAMVRASAYRAVGGYRDDYGTSADLEMWVRLARSAPIAVMDDYLYRYRRGHGSASEHYQRLRTEPETFFRIIDEALVIQPSPPIEGVAQAAYRAHRAEDEILSVVNLYILDRLPEARARADAVALTAVLGSARIQRWRLALLLLGLRLLTRLPRQTGLADLFQRRWHGGRGPTRRHERSDAAGFA